MQCADKYHDVHSCVRQISNGTNEGHVELVQLRATQIICPGILDLNMDNWSVAGEHNLVESDLHGGFLLDVADSTLGEDMPLNFKLAELSLDIAYDIFHDVLNYKSVVVLKIKGGGVKLSP